ncbi:ribulose-phosphate 3-epimerase [uncultured Hymenobacter sp.]|uniref:ribulose-phosphate 3-epimerase n=1 Tax=uncultured Hymenobacter sp. TaxID=170016 RepID=UPI0035CB7243
MSNSRPRRPLLAPSLLAADLANLQGEAERLAGSAADWLHFDVMDGRFVPNISFGLPILAALRRHARQPIDVHLMLADPQPYLAAFHDAGAANLTVHYEACVHLHRVVEQIKSLGCRAGVALNPHTPVSVLEDLAADLDVVLIMSVNPGFGGQQFIPNTLRKVAALKELLLDTGSGALIEIDGGVSLANAGPLVAAGADVLVAGNFVFSAPEGPVATLAALREHLAGLEVEQGSRDGRTRRSSAGPL